MTTTLPPSDTPPTPPYQTLPRIAPASSAVFDDPQTLIGRVVGACFRVDELIGAGGQAFVYRGFDLSLNQPCALKVAHNAAHGERLAREATIALLRLKNSRHVARVYARGVLPDGRTPFFVLDYLTGETLEKRLDRIGPLPVPDAFRLILEIAEALADVHRQGIVHRDVKPANIMLCRNDKNVEIIKLLDFGIARVFGEKTITAPGAMFGTPPFMAPEQTVAHSVDKRADVYALGCVLVSALAGPDALPVPTLGNADNIIAAASRKQDIRPLVPGISDEAASIVMRATDIDPARRFQTMEDFAAALRQYLAAFASGDDVSSDDMRLRRLRRRVIWLAAFAGVAAGIIIALTTSTDSRQRVIPPKHWIHATK